MRTTITALMILLGLHSICQAAGYFIQAEKETTERRESQLQGARRAPVSVRESDTCYVFKITPMSGDTQAKVQAEWVVLMEGMGGKLYVGTQGSQALELSATIRQVEFRTDPVAVSERESHGGPGHSGSSSEYIYGYALRIVDDAGAVLAEKYAPSRIEKKIDWTNRGQSGDTRETGPTRVGNRSLAPAGDIQTSPARNQRNSSMY